jgi:RNA polymerase sigma-70 factor, ECF subfamily
MHSMPIGMSRTGKSSYQSECDQMRTIDHGTRHDRFVALFAASEEALWGFVRSLTPTREDAREVMQEVACVLWSKFDQLVRDEDFRRWAFGVARFEILAFVRDYARDRHIFGEETIELLSLEVEQQSDQLDAERQALQECLRKLPHNLHVLVEAAYAPGARIDDLAASMGRTAMSIYKQLHRIRTILIDCASRSLTRHE